MANNRLIPLFLCQTILMVLTSNFKPSIARLDRSRTSGQADISSSSVAGPNTCGNRYRRQCCTGWTQHKGSNRCLVPVCKGDCDAGTCMRPNMCLCPNGQISPSCSSGSSSGCAVRCMNGGTCSGTICICVSGFQGPFCGQPSCQDSCQNGGRCLRPGKCACTYGFTGDQCEADFRTGPCFTEISDNMCRGQLIGVVCTKTLCCSTIGKAWGNPCEQCPEQPGQCRRGFILNIRTQECQDIDECRAIPGLCVGGTCVNTMGSYTCQCDAGQRKNEITNACEDINECEFGNICEHGQCHNTEGSYFCSCDEGYELNEDRTRCLVGQQGLCYRDLINNACRNQLEGTFTQHDCCCRLKGEGWSEGNTCQICPERGTEQYDRYCGDLQLVTCSNLPDGCRNGRCEALPDGSYKCVCNDGFRKTEEGRCVDINECDMSGLCLNGVCKNTEGSFECKCRAGYQLSSDGTYCSDMDECEHSGMCPNGECVNMDGSYKCVCKDGFKQSPNQQICIDINECTENGRLCRNGECMNFPGYYSCQCNAGYQLSPDGAFCHDMDECASTGMCTNGQCVNVAGSFRCLCTRGFILSPDGHVCIDIDECSESQDLCHNGNCINQQGSFRCECPLEFTLSPDGRRCIETRQGFCYLTLIHGQCVNPTGSPMKRTECCCAMHAQPDRPSWGPDCSPCPSPGSSQYQSMCAGPVTIPGINECRNFPGLCKDGTCEDLEHGYRCLCETGYIATDNFMLCQDINECEEDRNLCEGGQCINNLGSFYCNCPEGSKYDEASRKCIDVNECIEVVDACINADCINLPTGYRCQCRVPGTALDSTGRICVDTRKGMCWSRVFNNVCEGDVGLLLTKAQCCAGLGEAWGSPCQICSEAPEFRDCPEGYYKPDGVTCRDLDECSMVPDICKGGGTCINLDGSFSCECPPYLTLDPDTMMCEDLRQEECYGAYYNNRCTNPFIGPFTRSRCCCGLGKAWGSLGCEQCPATGTDDYNELCPRGGGLDDGDINECTDYQNICVNGRCRNTIGSFICDCNQGFAIDSSGFNCTDIDECSISNNICGNGTCRNTPGRFTCDCQEGFESTMMMLVCMDIDECSKDPGLCRGGHCINTIGSYQCQCPEGHELMRGGNACKDIDECSMSSGICSNGRCENFMGGYECICDVGYKPNPSKTACTDIDECRISNAGCMNTCLNSPGSFLCECRRGYRLDFDGKNCIDINECEELDVCSGGECSNMPGTYRCMCAEGTHPSSDHKSCIDIDECEFNRNLCLHGDCKNTLGSFVCNCERGYSVKPDGEGCVDDDECRTGTHACHEFASCINTQGSYRCRCDSGFTGNGFSCSDANECLRGNGGCSYKADCINSPGSYDCICEEGYEGDGSDCRDVDECALDPNLCDNGQCLNSAGGYRCDCDMGFGPADNNHICIDIDECESFPNLCVNGKCENMHGVYRCICSQGYQLDFTGGNCTDIDECEDTDNCKFGICSNRPGTYSCVCPPDFELNPAGNGCIDRRVGTCYLDKPRRRRGGCTDELGIDMTKATCCCTAGRSWQQTRSGLCEACPANNTAEYERLCPGGPGFRPNTLTVLMEDVDECQEIPGLCKRGMCVNTFGSFTCTCSTGYELDTRTMSCVDVDECRLNLAICGVGTCINTDGNYTCICPEGHMLMPDRNCMDMRKGNCYRDAYNTSTSPVRSVCENAMARNLTKKVCCCTGFGKGWSTSEHTRAAPCELCPREMTPEFSILCGSDTLGEIVDPVTGKPTNVNECDLIPGLCLNGHCIDLRPGFRCDCPTGYRHDRISQICADIDECLEGSRPPCVGNARCVNSAGSFRCTCPEGYNLAPNGRVCSDIDECRTIPGICAQGTCLNVVGSFSCQCMEGYTLAPSRDRCTDMDECSDRRGMCRNGTCHNTDGSYTCVCDSGFEQDQYQRCVDIDECRRQFGLCQSGHCRNTQGNYECYCQPGFEQSPDKHSCLDMNECLDTRMCQNGHCDNVQGSFVCICDEGYTKSRDQHTCVDVDECLDRDNCVGGRCRNVDGSYSCICPDGYQLTPEGKVCMDMRKGICYQTLEEHGCAEPRHRRVTKNYCCCGGGAGWSENQICEICPEQGSANYHFLCPDGPGYVEAFPGVITDINECVDIPRLCENGKCMNTDGSYRCTCNTGFTLSRNGSTCIDLNECRQTGACGNGTCRNTVGGFECSCGSGYAPGPNGVCEDIDECSEEINNCAFRCHNVLGTFHCICPRGYQVAADGRHCEDVDECLTPSNDCKYACKNQVGTFLCICPEGYRQVGEECEDINECRTLLGICEHGRCINNRGGYRCDCFSGFELSLDGKSCLDYRDGYCFPVLVNGQCLSDDNDLLPSTKVECCCTQCSGIAAWGARCERCPQDGTAEFSKLCPFGCGYGNMGQDIDECRSMPDACRNGKCINTMGSYKCRCNNGYRVDISGSSCIDINECSEQPSPCQLNCQNTDGSFLCSCLPGYRLAEDGRTCTDMDECATGRHNCPHSCTNTPGSFVCDCPPGHQRRGLQCVDVDECVMTPGLCLPLGSCINTQGSYRCECQPGYSLDPSGTQCVDIDECDDELMCQYGCQNMIGAYKCECPIGFQEHFYWNQCVDDNECLRAGVCGMASCLNTVGGYNCQCGGGGLFDAQAMDCIGLGGSGCAGSPCQFGCTSTQRGFVCGCPEGFQRIGQGHCVSTISPPGSSLQPGHEDTGLPPGEGCYHCENAKNYNGIPLQQPHQGTQLLHLRYKRHLGGQDPVIINVGGPHAKLHPAANNLPKNSTEQKGFLHLEDLLQDSTQTADPARYNDEQIDINKLRSASFLNQGETADLRPDEPIALYLTRDQTGPNTKVLNIMPALSALRNNEVCIISGGNKHGLFSISEKSGMSSLRFTRRVVERGTYKVELTCRPVDNTALPDQDLTPTVVLFNLHTL